MKLFTILSVTMIFFILLTCILFVIFGQVTVRKLRKNQAVKDHLGAEFVSGWDVLNVAKALSLPKWVNDKFKESPLSFLYADSKLLYTYTNKFDRILARVFYSLYWFTALFSITVISLNESGLLE